MTSLRGWLAIVKPSTSPSGKSPDMIRGRAPVSPKSAGTPRTMRIFRQPQLARITLVWTLVIALLSVLPMHVFAHVTTEQADELRHAGLSVLPTDVEHSHDDGDDDERRPGHRHGHGVSDHAHDTSWIAPTSLTIAPQEAVMWQLAHGPGRWPGMVFGLDRPPRG